MSTETFPEIALGEGPGKNSREEPGRVGTRRPIPEVTPEGLRAEHPEVGDHAAASGVGPSDRNAAIAASNAEVQIMTRLMSRPSFRARGRPGRSVEGERNLAVSGWPALSPSSFMVRRCQLLGKLQQLVRSGAYGASVGTSAMMEPVLDGARAGRPRIKHHRVSRPEPASDSLANGVERSFAVTE